MRVGYEYVFRITHVMIPIYYNMIPISRVYKILLERDRPVYDMHTVPCLEHVPTLSQEEKIIYYLSLKQFYFVVHKFDH